MKRVLLAAALVGCLVAVAGPSGAAPAVVAPPGVSASYVPPTAPPGTPVLATSQIPHAPPGSFHPPASTTSAVWNCLRTLTANATDTRQLTEFSVNTGVLGPNVYIWGGAEIAITNPNLYGYAVGYVNTSGSVASGPFVNNGIYYVSLALFQPNILVMVPLYELYQSHSCAVPPSPLPVWG